MPTKTKIKCTNGCYDRPPFNCTCKGNIKIKNPFNVETLKEESELGESLKDGHTKRRLGGKHHKYR